MSGFTAPIGGDSKRVDNVALIPAGFALCTFYGICDIGTVEGGNYGPRHKVNLAFEFPKEMRLFYEGDDPKPSCIFAFETLSMHSDSNLRKRFIEPMNGGRKFTDQEAVAFDLSSLLGKHYIATIAHSPDGKWANIQSLVPLNEQNKDMFGLPTSNIPQINKTYYFNLDQGFTSENFATLPKFLREKLMGSEEGKAYKLSGGVFAEPIDNNSNSVVTPKLRMIDTTVSYEDYIAGGWTDEQLIAHGKAEKVAPVTPPAPITNVAPPPPVANTVAPPPVAVSPLPPVLTMKDPSHNLAEWLAQGWTEETLVANGHAVFQ
jgi:hypothetical protein